MDFIKKYTSHEEYEVDKTPNVSLCIEDNETKHLHYTKKKFDDEYLTFEALESGTFTLTIGSGVTTGDVSSVSYSLDGGETWTTTNNVQGQQVVITTPTVNAGDEVLWKGNANRMTILANANSASTFSSTANFNARGNAMSLLYGDEFKGEVNLTGKNYCFSYLFRNNGKLINGKNLSLPATTLAEGCYAFMFAYCTGLTTTPELLAITLTSRCYQYMFSDCTSLMVAPELPATTLADFCYYYMFYDCTRLTVAPELPAATMKYNCYSNMFTYCTSLTTAPELPATTLAGSCYQYMFSGCTSLTIAPELPATTLASTCYSNMFQGCTNLTTAPELPATTLAQYCYSYMFRGCISLTTAPELPATTLANWCYAYMFSDCTSLTVAPELPVMILAQYCYYYMFYGCTSLVNAPELPATTLVQYCYSDMFNGCTSLTTAPELPATTLTNNCYNSMFYKCTSLTTAPELPATTLASNCYLYMFYGCTNLNFIKCMAENNIDTDDSTTEWVSFVPTTGTFIASNEATWSYGNNGVPYGWNSNIDVNGRVPLLRIWIDDFIDNNDFSTMEDRAEDWGYSDVEKYVSAIVESGSKLGGNPYLYFGDTFEYDGNTYYLWEYSGEQYDVQYLLTDTIDYNELYEMSLDYDSSNESCPYIVKLDGDFEETYDCASTNDWLISVDEF